MKRSIILFLFIFPNIFCQGQDWGGSEDCNINVNNPNQLNELLLRNKVISSTVKLRIEGGCSGTLINRNTSDGNLGYYVLTAKHCINNLNWDTIHTVYCNYQSPDGTNESTFVTNRGITDWQSNTFNPDPDIEIFIENGYEYRHQSQLRLVQDFFWGDFALIEILTPLPPHFNVSFAGWNPSQFYNEGLVEIPLPTSYVGIHHPSGDIKKITGINHIEWAENPVATSCYTITTIIDVLFGWIWGNSVSTSVICNYVDNPWMIVPINTYGSIEGGSSGSGLFNVANRNIGVLSGSLSSCSFPAVTTYGKLHSNYSNTAIKNTLNPSNELFVDLFGMVGRKITCYENLILPGAEGVSGQYFPANHYQEENEIALQAVNNITTTQPITIIEDAEYVFVAGSSIDINPGFTVENGASFDAIIGECDNWKSFSQSKDQILTNLLNEIELPKRKVFDISEYATANKKYSTQKDVIMKSYPNPTNGLLNLTISSHQPNETFQLELLTITGGLKMEKTIVIENYKEVEINLNKFQPGVYILHLYNSSVSINERIIKTE